MTRLVSWLMILVLFGTFAAVVYDALRARAEAGKDMPACSVYSEEADGLAEAAQELRQLGWEPIALTRPILHTAQSHAKNCLLIVADPQGTALLPGQAPDLSDVDVSGLLQWVEQGNTLLLSGRHITALHRALNVLVTSDARADQRQTNTVVLSKALRYTDGIDRLVVEGRDVVQAGAALPLWWLDEQPGAILVRRGKGRVLVVADCSLLTRRGLSRADNRMFLANVAALHARDGRVYFDEYHHGLRSGGGFWGYLRFRQQHWLVLLVLFVVAMAGWAVAVRLGRAVPAPRQSHADAVDYASAVARIYQRAGVRHLLARTLSRDFVAALTGHLHLRRSVLPAEILAAWRLHRPGDSAQLLQALLRGVVELRKGEVSERQLLAWARAFDQFKAEVLRAR